MLNPNIQNSIEFDREHPGYLLVVVDTEEEFDWAEPHNSAATGVQNIAEQYRAHQLFDRYEIRPTYVVDYPVASKPEGYQPLRQLQDDGKCQIGAHLHPWVSPPFEEDVCNFNSYPGNLPTQLEQEKLARLAALIKENFGALPNSYKAGRYGVGPNSAKILADNKMMSR